MCKSFHSNVEDPKLKVSSCPGTMFILAVKFDPPSGPEPVKWVINWFKDRKNAPNADKYILDNYYLFKDLSPWIIYKKK